MAEAALGLPVRIGFPKRDKRMQRDYEESNVCHRGRACALWVSCRMRTRMFCPDTFTGIFGKMKEWVKGIFNIKKEGTI